MFLPKLFLGSFKVFTLCLFFIYPSVYKLRMKIPANNHIRHPINYTHHTAFHLSEKKKCNNNLNYHRYYFDYKSYREHKKMLKKEPTKIDRHKINESVLDINKRNIKKKIFS